MFVYNNNLMIKVTKYATLLLVTVHRSVIAINCKVDHNASGNGWKQFYAKRHDPNVCMILLRRFFSFCRAPETKPWHSSVGAIDGLPTYQSDVRWPLDCVDHVTRLTRSPATAAQYLSCPLQSCGDDSRPHHTI